MKRAVVLLLFCFLILSVKAQQYHPLVDSGAVWNQEITNADWDNGVVYFVTGIKYFLEGDTMISFNDFSKLWMVNTYAYTAGPGYFYGGNGNDSSNAAQLVGGLREDSSKKIWFYSFTDDSASLMYDFSSVVGDTLKWPQYVSVISSIDSIQLLNGEWRRRFVLNNIWSYETWIEGIGSTFGLFGAQELSPFETTYNLSCYRNNNELLYENLPGLATYVSCDEINGIDETISSATFETSPNPTSDFLSINFSSPNFSSAEIKIVDLLGRNLFADEIKSGETKKISTEKFPQSIVFCQLWQNGELIETKKVLIQ